jgi:hypothetical protein
MEEEEGGGGVRVSDFDMICIEWVGVSF